MQYIHYLFIGNLNCFQIKLLLSDLNISIIKKKSNQLNKWVCIISGCKGMFNVILNSDNLNIRVFKTAGKKFYNCYTCLYNLKNASHVITKTRKI